MAKTDLVLSLLFIVLQVLLLIGLIRMRRSNNRDIRLAEISPDASAGDDLLREVLEAERSGPAGRAGSLH